jgi:superoxide dismutase, Fe-Mn family
MVSRRQFLITASAATTALASLKLTGQVQAAEFALPKLPYAYDALEPSIDGQTMEIHHTKHHQAYITRLNSTLAEHAPALFDTPLVDLVANYRQLPDNVSGVVRNHGGGHLNHSLFWTMMSPAGSGGAPSPELMQALAATFGDIDGFKAAMLAKATGQFGSGWAWLVVGPDGKLQATSTPNQDNPVMDGQTPLLGVDVWEHAYYLKYQSARAAYVEAWMKVINWNRVNELYAAAKA